MRLEEHAEGCAREPLAQGLGRDSLAESDDFMMTFQRLVTEQVWGRAWSGTALDKKTKSLLTLGILAALNPFLHAEREVTADFLVEIVLVGTHGLSPRPRRAS